jgi:hypothetical protein
MIRGIRCAVAFLVCVTTFLGIYWLGGVVSAMHTFRHLHRRRQE